MTGSVNDFPGGISAADYQREWAKRVDPHEAAEHPIAAEIRPTPDPSPALRCRCVPKALPTGEQVYFLRCTSLAGPDGLCDSCRDPLSPCSVDGRTLVEADSPCFGA